MLMPYNSNRLFNFREFVESYTSPGAYVSDSGHEISSFDGRTHPQITLEFPTETVRGEVIRVTVKGANYSIQVNGGSTILIPRVRYRKKYNRLPRPRTKGKDGNSIPGDMITAVFFKYKPREQENYSLKDFKLDSAG
jgi:hypothetical protein